MQDDIYKMEKKEGIYLIEQLEKLRCIRKKGDITIKCTDKNNSWIEMIRRRYILGNHLNSIFLEARAYYLLVESDTVAVLAVFDAGYIKYYLRGEMDWKLIEVEVFPLGYPVRIDNVCDKIAGRIEVAALLALVQLSHQYGFSRVFKSESPKYLKRLFKEVVSNEVIEENDFNLELKVMELLSQNGMRKEFVETYIKTL